jgi:copper chaperone CopZ
MEQVSKLSRMARIELQQSFCAACALHIKATLQDIAGVKNIRLYPKDTLITFNFTKADRLSTLLNRLYQIGYTEKGEEVAKSNLHLLGCKC